ncbi:hypothetical protein ACLQ24_00530 [Micromonospora sp. DT4]|uniref:hypothetical protein n=1 Tax=Micromonospora sp. DT4 TaxID=3393438 RepID=UPI003CEEF7C3
MGSSGFAEQRAQNLDRARRSGLPDSVAQLFAVVQEPRCDEEPSHPQFVAALDMEASALRSRVDAVTREFGTASRDRFGGIVESETAKAAQRLIVAAEDVGMEEAAKALRAALSRCRSIPQQRLHGSDRPSFPQPERILNPETGRPIGLWR